MAFHGHTKIELHNVKTGEDKVIEKHNIFTNYLHDVMQVLPTPKPTNWMSCGKGSKRYENVQWGNQDGLNYNTPSIVDVLCGGILCLENEHEENPDNYFLTGDDVITARGSCIANGSVDTQLGSYNKDLEKSSDTSKTMVWDFAQNQGNGTISTIGLTSIGMALCGLGKIPKDLTHNSSNPFGDVSLAKRMISNACGYYDDVNTKDSHTAFAIFCSLEHSILVTFVGINSNILHLRYYDLNSNKINPMSVGSAYSTSSSYPKNKIGRDGDVRYSPVDRITFDLSSYSFTGYSYLNMYVTKDGILHICPRSSYQWNANDTMTFVKIDLINRKILGTYTITNTSGVTLRTNSAGAVKAGQHFESGTQHTEYCQIVNEYMLFRTYNSPYRTFAINIENSTDVREILTEEGESFNLTYGICNFAGGRLVSNTTKITNTTNTAYIINPEKGIAKRVRTGLLADEIFAEDGANVSFSLAHALTSDSDIVNMWHCGSNSGHFRYDCSFVGMAYKQDTLSTINVLDEPVTKTADMTMRITYTISLEEDEG